MRVKRGPSARPPTPANGTWRSRPASSGSSLAPDPAAARAVAATLTRRYRLRRGGRRYLYRRRRATPSFATRHPGMWMAVSLARPQTDGQWVSWTRGSNVLGMGTNPYPTAGPTGEESRESRAARKAARKAGRERAIRRHRRERAELDRVRGALAQMRSLLPGAGHKRRSN